MYVWYCQFCLLSFFSFSFFLFSSLLYSCCCSFLYSDETTFVTHAHTYEFDTGLILASSLRLFLLFLFFFFFVSCFFRLSSSLISPTTISISIVNGYICVHACVFLSNYRIVTDRNRVNIVLTPVSSSYFFSSAVVCVFFSERTQLF